MPRAAAILAVLALLLGGGCDDPGGDPPSLAQRLSSRLDFAGEADSAPCTPGTTQVCDCADGPVWRSAERRGGLPPAEHLGEAGFPQVVSFAAPVLLVPGEDFQVDLYTDFVRPEAIASVVVQVDEASEYLAIDAAYDAGERRVRVPGRFSTDPELVGHTFVVRLALLDAQGAAGNYALWQLSVRGAAGDADTDVDTDTDTDTDTGPDQGLQVCRVDGRGWGACACADSLADADADGDLDTDADADADGDADTDADGDADSDSDWESGLDCDAGGECRDEGRGLVWQRDVARDLSWADAGSHCAGLVLGGVGGWRLPSIAELRSLVTDCPPTARQGTCPVDDGCGDADCWDATCLGCPAGAGLDEGCYWPPELDGDCARPCWSATPLGGYGEFVWRLDFATGAVEYGDPTSRNQVRCVR